MSMMRSSLTAAALGADMQLDHGRKWGTDAPLRTSMTAIRKNSIYVLECDEVQITARADLTVNRRLMFQCPLSMAVSTIATWPCKLIQ